MRRPECGICPVQGEQPRRCQLLWYTSVGERVHGSVANEPLSPSYLSHMSGARAKSSILCQYTHRPPQARTTVPTRASVEPFLSTFLLARSRGTCCFPKDFNGSVWNVQNVKLSSIKEEVMVHDKIVPLQNSIHDGAVTSMEGRRGCVF